jgi:hypothetical protein
LWVLSHFSGLLGLLSSQFLPHSDWNALREGRDRSGEREEARSHMD